MSLLVLKDFNHERTRWSLLSTEYLLMTLPSSLHAHISSWTATFCQRYAFSTTWTNHGYLMYYCDVLYRPTSVTFERNRLHVFGILQLTLSSFSSCTSIMSDSISMFSSLLLWSKRLWQSLIASLFWTVWMLWMRLFDF